MIDFSVKELTALEEEIGERITTYGGLVKLGNDEFYYRYTELQEILRKIICCSEYIQECEVVGNRKDNNND